MKHHRISPHGNSYCVVPESEAVSTDKEPLRLWCYPYCEQQQEIDKIAHVGEEVVVASLMVCVISYGHEIAELRCEPVVEVFRMCSYQVAANEHIQHSGDKRKLLPRRYGFGVIPSCTESLN